MRPGTARRAIMRTISPDDYRERFQAQREQRRQTQQGTDNDE